MSYRWTEEDVQRKQRKRAISNIASITPVRPAALPAGSPECGGISQCRGGDANRKARSGALSPRRALPAAPSEPPVYAIVGMCRAAGLPEPVPEYRFHTRRWRFDYAWPCIFLALEIDGGVWANGRHSRGSGRILEMEKMSEAAIDGWRVIYATPDDVRSGAVMDRIQRALGAGPKEVA